MAGGPALHIGRASHNMDATMSGTITDTLTLNNGRPIPLLGLGTWRADDAAAEQAVRAALAVGYRHIDTAAVYGNERGVGRAVRGCGVPRQEIFVTTKVWNDDIRLGRDGVLKAVEVSLAKLDIDYIDLYLLHWPVPGMYVEAWQALEEIYAAGKVKAIGVSNFLSHHLQDLLPQAKITPAMDQLEFHPCLQQPGLRALLRQHNIALTAWAPLMKGKVLDIPELREIAGRYRRTASQVVLRWMIQQQIVMIPKSVNRPRIEENARLYDFELSAVDMAKIHALDAGQRVGPDPDHFTF